MSVRWSVGWSVGHAFFYVFGQFSHHCPYPIQAHATTSAVNPALLIFSATVSPLSLAQTILITRNYSKLLEKSVANVSRILPWGSVSFDPMALCSLVRIKSGPPGGIDNAIHWGMRSTLGSRSWTSSRPSQASKWLMDRDKNKIV